MNLPDHSRPTIHLLDGTEKSFDTRVAQIEAEIDHVVMNSAADGNRHQTQNELLELFAKRAAMQSALEAVREFRRDQRLFPVFPGQ